MKTVHVLAIALVSAVSIAQAAFAEDQNFRVGGRAEPQLTERCVADSLGCRADGYPDARYYRPALDQEKGTVYNYNDRRYYDPSGAPLGRSAGQEVLTSRGTIKEIK